MVMKHLTRIFYLFALVAFAACNEKDDNFATLTSELAEAPVAAAGGIVKLNVEASGTWVISVDASQWAKLSKAYGSGADEVDLTLSANTTTAERSCVVKLESGDVTARLTVRQAAAVGGGEVNGENNNNNENNGENNGGSNNENNNENGGGNANTDKPVAKGWSADMCMPELKDGNIFRPFVVVEGGDSILDFALEWDPARRHSRWVAFSFYNTTAARNWARNDWDNTEWGGDPFQEDPMLPAASRTTLADYKGSGYDRGHLVASADRLFSKDANYYTFFLSNMSPQKASFNRYVWAGLEDLVQDWGRNASLRDTLYVCKGGTIDNEDDIETYVRNMPVPRYYFMAIVARKGDSYKGISFILEHRTDYSSPYNFKQYALSIDALEERTGINFFCNLPADVEASVEASYDVSQWVW